jgi:glutamyl-tRNA(Gln) amidotransferase subunit E
MYPETDVESITITQDRLERLKSAMPEMPEAKLKRLMSDYGLNEKLARQLVGADLGDRFELLASNTQVSATIVAVTLTETLKSLEREGKNVDVLTDDSLREVFSLIDNGAMMKESMIDVLRWLTDHPDAEPKKALRALNLSLVSKDDLRLIVDSKVEENREMVERMGEKAMGPLMGIVMGSVRGRARPEDVQALLKEALNRNKISES